MDDPFGKLEQALKELNSAVGDLQAVYRAPKFDASRAVEPDARMRRALPEIRTALAGAAYDLNARDALNFVGQLLSSQPRLLLKDFESIAERVQAVLLDPSRTTRQQGKATRRLSRETELETIRTLVRQMRDEGSSYAAICEQLANHPRPPRAAWRQLTWPKAYAHPTHHGSVKSWLSKALRVT
jgi:hypothetical protein